MTVLNCDNFVFVMFLTLSLPLFVSLLFSDRCSVFQAESDLRTATMSKTTMRKGKLVEWHYFVFVLSRVSRENLSMNFPYSRKAR